MSQPLMPKATAVWLVDNTALTFEQIADFCSLHVLEVKGIADGDVAQGIKGLDPVAAGQLTRDEIERCEQETGARLKLLESKHELPPVKPRKGPKYTPLSRRQERPDAIMWLLRNHPELTDAQVGKLVGTTKPTIQSVRDRTHWNSANIKPVDPVTLGLCSQIELDAAVQKAAKRVARETGKLEKQQQPSATLLSAEETTVEPAPLDEESEPSAASHSAESVFGAAEAPAEAEQSSAEDEAEKIDLDSVFAKLKGLKLDEQQQD